MNTLLIAFIKINIAVVLSYSFYKLLFSRDTFLTAKRAYLNSTLLFALLLPFIDITPFFKKKIIAETIQTGNITLPDIFVFAGQEQSGIDLSTLSIALYLTISLILVIKIIIQIISVERMKSTGEKTRIGNHEVFVIHRNIAPFSFMGNIFVNPALHRAEELEEILIHESAHVRQLHSQDVIIAEIMTALCWINPFMWLMKKEIRQNLEFMADQEVLKTGRDSKSYQYHLLRLSCPDLPFPITNQFNISPLKKRIMMMNKTKTSKPAAVKYLLAIPFAAAMIFMSNVETIASNATLPLSSNEQENAQLNEISAAMATENAQSAETTKSEKQQSSDDAVFTVVENMPKYPGGDQALFKYLSENIKYPESAIKTQTQGRVITQFVVDKDGSITDVKIIRGIDPALDSEAMRVVKSMQNWTPGTQRGKIVRVKYTLPINFSLNNEKKELKRFNMSVASEEKKVVVFVDGKRMPENFDFNLLNVEMIEKIDVKKPSGEEEKAQYIKEYGPNADKGIIFITSKK